MRHMVLAINRAILIAERVGDFGIRRGEESKKLRGVTKRTREEVGKEGFV